MLATVTAFREPWEAQMFCSRLEAEGIPAFVSHEGHIGNAWHYSVALGGVKVQVPKERVHDAHEIARLCWSGEFKSLLERDFGDLDDVRCPKCGSKENWRRRSLVRGAAAIVVSIVFGMIVPPLGWVYYCQKCNVKYVAPLYTRPVADWLNILVVIVCELIVLMAMALFVWAALDPRYRFVPIAITGLIAALLVRRWIAGLQTDQE